MTRFTRFIATLCLSVTPAVLPAGPVVVELFTSQGCSSCPPADAILHELAEREDVIALALHVDYWDYIGWKDEFAVPGHADRQRAYAQHAGRRSIYTPEMVVDGTTDIVGAKPMELSKALMKHAGETDPTDVELTREGEKVRISAAAFPNAPEMELHVLNYQNARTTRITRGENAGRTITYANVVQNWRTVSRWDGQADLDLSVEADPDLSIVVLLQEKGPGSILAAARLR